MQYRTGMWTGMLGVFLLPALAKGQGIVAQNQADGKNIVILPVEKDANAPDDSGGLIFDGVLGKADLSKVSRISLIEGQIDKDGCRRAPIAPPEFLTEGPSMAVEAVAEVLRARGKIVTILSAEQLVKADKAEQKQTGAVKDHYELGFGEDPARMLLTKQELLECRRIENRRTDLGRASAVMAREMNLLDKDVVLTVFEEERSIHGPKWNFMSSGIAPAESRVELLGGLALRNGLVPWEAQVSAVGRLSPAAEAEIEGKLVARAKAAMEDAAPKKDTEESSDDKLFNRVFEGDVTVPAGMTLAPSLAATRMATAERLVAALGIPQTRDNLSPSPGIIMLIDHSRDQRC